MNEQWQRFTSLVLLGVLGAGIIVFLVMAVTEKGGLNGDDTGWIAAGFLSLREVMSKIEAVSLGIHRPVARGDLPLRDRE